MGFAGPTTPGLQQQQPGGQQGRDGDPQLTYQDPVAYIAWLRTKRLDPITIDRMVTERFGPGKTPEQRAKEAAKAQQMQGFGQIGGTLAGMYGAQQLGGLFGSGAGATGAGAGATAGTGAVATPTLVGAKMVGGAGTTGGASTLGSLGAVALPAAAIAVGLNNMWETGMKDILRGRGTREDWINQGVNLLGGGLPNLALRLMGKRSIGSMVTSGKSEAQQLRDYFRTDLKDAGLVDKDYNVTLAGGETFNIGKDGKTRYTNVDNKTTRQAWDVDFNNPLAKYATDVIDPIVRAKYGNNPNLPLEQLTGMFVNAVTSNAKDSGQVQANIKSALGQFAPQELPQYKGGEMPKPTTPEPAPRPIKKQSLRQTLDRKMKG